MLMGLPRSGTTWLGKIFDSHPRTLYRHEPDALMYEKFVRPRLPVSYDSRYAEAVFDFADAALGSTKPRSVLKAPWFRKCHYPRVAWVRRWLQLHTARLATRLGREPEDIPDGIAMHRMVHVRPVWKSVSCTPILGTLARLLPQSRSISILRHPCGYVGSVLRGTRAAKFLSSPSEDPGLVGVCLRSESARERRLTAADFDAMAPSEKLAWRWVAGTHEIVATTDSLPNVMTVRFEDLCAEPASVARSLFDFADLSWHDQTADFIRRSTAIEHSSFYSVFKNPMHSAKKWQAELSATDVQRIESVVRGTAVGALYGF